MKKSILIVALMLNLSLIGCASVPLAPPEDDARAKSFVVEPDKSTIYIYRNEVMGAAITMPVSIDGKVAGKTASRTYFALTVEPGEHEIASLTENTSKITVDAVAGRNHFIWQEVKMGMWGARSLLQEVSEEAGRAGVAECKLIAVDW